MKSFFLLFLQKPLSLRSLPLTLPKEEKNDHQWLMTVANTTPRAGFTLRREHCNSSSWFRVLYTIRETSLVTNYRNDPWKYSLLFLFFNKSVSKHSYIFPNTQYGKIELCFTTNEFRFSSTHNFPRIQNYQLLCLSLFPYDQ